MSKIGNKDSQSHAETGRNRLTKGQFLKKYGEMA